MATYDSQASLYMLHTTADACRALKVAADTTLAPITWDDISQRLTASSVDDYTKTVMQVIIDTYSDPTTAFDRMLTTLVECLRRACGHIRVEWTASHHDWCCRHVRNPHYPAQNEAFRKVLVGYCITRLSIEIIVWRCGCAPRKTPPLSTLGTPLEHAEVSGCSP